MHMRKRSLLRSALLALALVSQHTAALAQPSPKFELTVDSIMRGPDLVGYAPQDVRWSRDGRRVYFRWKRAGEPRLKEYDTYTVDRDGAGLRKLTEEEAKQAPPTTGNLSKDKKLTVFTDEGDIFLYDHTKNIRQQLTRTVEAETNPRFTLDQRRVYFTRQNNLYILSLDGGSLEQLTDIRTGGGGGGASASGGGGGAQGQGQGGASAPPPQRGNESQETVKREERELLEAVRERAEKREQDEARRKQRERRKPFNLSAGQGVVSLTLSPDGRYVVAAVTEPATGAKNTIVPNYVTESAYTEDIPARTKVGDAQTRGRVAVINAETGDFKWVEHGQRVDVAPRVRTRTESNATEQAQRERGDTQQQSTTQATTQTQQQTPPRAEQQQTQTEATQATQQRDRDVQLFAVQWSDDGRHAALIARSTDNKDRWVMLLDPSTGRTRVLFNEHDEAWTNGPGQFTLGWLPDNRRVYFQSERDGFAHLYTVPVEGGQPTQLTSGQFEVSNVRLSEDETRFYFTSSEGSFFERHLYSMPVAGGARTRLTSMVGNNDVDVSPDEKMFAVVNSYSNRPPELFLAAAPGAPDNGVKQITKSPLPEFNAYRWLDPPVVSFKARDGATVHARLYKPANFQRGGPAVLFVHGAGYLQNVHKWWSNYYREYMFHHLLMERGYVVLDIDYRGSAGYGRDWRTGNYRHMGGKDLT
ncbi:MAG TPA: DPP IV N-terminal domain-containing protein, partial [Pyrinomonadaceae bacterium]|nr:DPP IV N-terminal domain-containing protein [Pyrinomonadaceae bacterium]